MKIAAQMDHIASVNIHKDTTYALLLEAQQRGYTLYHYTPDALSFDENKVTAYCEKLTLSLKEGNHYQLSDPKKRCLNEMDVVLLRQDPPFDMHYITTTFLLEKLPKTTLVVNNPYWVRNSPEKLFVLQFEDLIPPTLITRDKNEILAFQKKYGEIIIKPLYGNGGAGVFHFKQEDANIHSLYEMFTSQYREAFIVQRYLPEVTKGDKRIILLDGEAVGAINRLPNNGEHRSNMHVGGQACATKLTDRDQEICKKIGPFLKERGFFLVGIDVIGSYLTEINVTSPTGLQEIRNFDNQDITQLFWDKILHHKNL